VVAFGYALVNALGILALAFVSHLSSKAKSLLLLFSLDALFIARSKT